MRRRGYVYKNGKTREINVDQASIVTRKEKPGVGGDPLVHCVDSLGILHWRSQQPNMQPLSLPLQDADALGNEAIRHLHEA